MNRNMEPDTDYPAYSIKLGEKPIPPIFLETIAVKQGKYGIEKGALSHGGLNFLEKLYFFLMGLSVDYQSTI